MGNWHMPKGQFGRAPLEWRPLPHMEEYLDELATRFNTPDSIRAVKKGLAHFAIFAREDNIRHPAEVERRQILRFLAYLQDQGFRPSYQQRLAKYVRSWFNWLLDVYPREVTVDPWHRIKVGNTEKKPDPLSDDEVNALFEAHKRDAFQKSPFIFHRRETILVAFFGWALRIHELHSMNVSQVDARLDYVKVINKGAGERMKTLPYGPQMKQVMMRWLPIRGRYAVPGEDALLIEQSGNRLGIDSIRKTIVELGRHAGVDVNPHRIRDTVGTRMLNANVAAERVQQILGHTNLKQTLQYAEVQDHKVAEDHARVVDSAFEGLLMGRTGR